MEASHFVVSAESAGVTGAAFGFATAGATGTASTVAGVSGTRAAMGLETGGGATGTGGSFAIGRAGFVADAIGLLKGGAIVAGALLIGACESSARCERIRTPPTAPITSAAGMNATHHHMRRRG